MNFLRPLTQVPVEVYTEALPVAGDPPAIATLRAKAARQMTACLRSARIATLGSGAYAVSRIPEVPLNYLMDGVGLTATGQALGFMAGYYIAASINTQAIVDQGHSRFVHLRHNPSLA